MLADLLGRLTGLGDVLLLLSLVCYNGCSLEEPRGEQGVEEGHGPPCPLPVPPAGTQNPCRPGNSEPCHGGGGFAATSLFGHDGLIIHVWPLVTNSISTSSPLPGRSGVPTP